MARSLLLKGSYWKKLPRLSLLFIPAFLVAAVAIFLNLRASIRLDEAQQLWASAKTIPGILEYIAQDVHVPLYALLLHIWMQIFGNSIVSARLLSVLFFVLSLWPLYVLAQRTAGERTARIAVSLYCLSPFLTWYSTEARMYTLFTFATILSHLTFFTVLRSKAKKGKLAYALSAILGIYSHYFFFIVLGLQTLYFFLWVALDSKSDSRSLFQKFWEERKAYLRFLPTLIIIGLSFLPWLVMLLLHGAGSNTSPQLTPPTSYNLLQVFINFMTGFQSPTLESILISIWPLVVVLLFFSFSQRKRVYPLHTDYFVLLTFVPIILAFIASYLFQPMLLSRYLIFLTPTLFYLLSILLTHFNRVLFVTILSIVFLSNLFFQYQQTFSPEIRERENYQEVASYLNEQVTESDVIAVSAPFTVYPIEYDYLGRARLDTIPAWNRYVTGSIPAFSKENLEQQIEEYRSRYDRMFVVLSYDQGYEDEIRQYLDNNLQRNTRREFSPGLEVIEYQLRYN